MMARWIRRIAFGGSGILMFWQASQSYARAGITTDTAFPAAVGAVMMVLAVTTRGG
ncbi:MAG TPA: hypothetical protein VGR03_12525 [Candidatus Acidoferrum sp.]|nr:hypothetical protein [Candidatus Acidoferrum sp.]